MFTVHLTAVAFSNYVENVVQQLNKNTKVSLNETLSMSIKYASERALKDAIENYKTKIQEFLDENPLPVKWELLDENEQKAMESSYKILQMSLNGSNELTKPVFESFNEEIYQYEKIGEELKLVGGIQYECRLMNSMIIKAKNKKLLNKLWKEGIVEYFFDRPHDFPRLTSWKEIIGDLYQRLNKILNEIALEIFRVFCHGDTRRTSVKFFLEIKQFLLA